MTTHEEPERSAPLPVGMLLLLAYMAFSIISGLMSLKAPILPLGPFLITGRPAAEYGAVVIVAVSGAFYGILRRKPWARPIIILWFLVEMANSLANLLAFLLDPQGMSRLYAPVIHQKNPSVVIAVLVWSLSVTWGVGLAAILYVNRQKAFFQIRKARDPSHAGD
jgi:hypothetical protein